MFSLQLKKKKILSSDEDVSPIVATYALYTFQLFLPNPLKKKSQKILSVLSYLTLSARFSQLVSCSLFKKFYDLKQWGHKIIRSVTFRITHLHKTIKKHPNS